MKREAAQPPQARPDQTRDDRARPLESRPRVSRSRDSRLLAAAAPRGTGKGRHPIRELGRAISWHRRKLAVLAAITAVLAGVNAAAPPDPPQLTVITAKTTLRGGMTVSADDLATVTLPTGAVPDQAFTRQASLLGQVLSGPIARGQVLTTLDILQAAAAPGQVLAPLRLADGAIIKLLHPGDLIDVIVADPQGGAGSSSGGAGSSIGGADIVAERVRIATIAQPASSSMLGSAGASDSAVVLVEVDSETAKLLAQASVSGSLSVTLR